MELTKGDIVNLVFKEREFQDKKFGKKNKKLTFSRYLNIILEEFGETSKEINDFYQCEDGLPKARLNYLNNAKTELIQMLAVGFQMLEKWDVILENEKEIIE